MTFHPELSIIVVPMVGQKALPGCLEALHRQSHDSPTFEIIVPTDERTGDLGELKAQFPYVQFIDLGGKRTYAELRAFAVHRAQGEIIAITEDHCRPEPDWCLQIYHAHIAPYAAIGGVVEKLTPDKPLNWAVYFADYLRYMPPLEAGTASGLTDLNVSYKRSELEAISEVWEYEFHEPSVHQALQERGQQLWLSPDIIVLQQRDLHWRAALWDRYAFGRLFASTRIAQAGLVKRFVYAGFSIIVPALQVWRTTRHILNKRRCQREYLRALPALILLSSIWAFGEMVGYLTGLPEQTLAPSAPAAPSSLASNN
jgi:hypothetical protein